MGAPYSSRAASASSRSSSSKPGKILALIVAVLALFVLLESDIADRREVFNEAATTLNTRIDQFPDLLFAGVLGYRRMDLLHSTEKERVQPSLKMTLG